jgi:serine/threonine protein kinase
MAVDSLHLLREEALAGNGVIADDAPTLDVEPHVARADEPTQDLPAGEPEGSVAAPVPMQASPPHGDDPFTAGRTLCGRYLIEGRVGGGGSAVVLRARDLEVGEAGGAAKEVAIKVLRPALRASEAAIERLQREFHRLRQLSHPGIVRVFELDRHEGQWFQVMELLHGDSLATLMSRPGGHPTEAQALALLADCADALASAHARGFVHGDIKPGNIFVKRDGRACLLDFGARDGGDEAGGVDGHRPVHATPAYASPQVLTGLAPEPRDDTFSFACVAFELLTGRHPFDRMNAARARDAGACIADVPYLDARRAGALAAGLSFEREGRPGDVRELVSRITVPAQQVLVPEPARAAPPDELG